jgi:hypothetical protein
MPEGVLIVVSRSVAVRASVVAYALCASSGHLRAQTARNIPIRTLAPSTAVSKDSVGPDLAVRELSSGSVLVNDYASRRVVLFDATLGQSKVVIDTIGGTGPDAAMKMATPAATLIRYLGDSALYADQLGNSLLVLDANGKVARVMSVPRSNDIPMLALSSQFGHPSLPKFSLTYERTLNEDLAALGMGIAFGDGADFSGLSSSPLYISSVKQKAFVDVNESGTEAAGRDQRCPGRLDAAVARRRPAVHLRDSRPSLGHHPVHG